MNIPKLLCVFLFQTLFVCTYSQSAKELHEKAVRKLEENRFEDAQKLVNKAILQGPVDINFLFTKARAEIGLKNFSAAFQCYAWILEQDPKNTRAYNNRGLLWQSLRREDEAIEDFTQEINYASNDMTRLAGYANRGTAKTQKRDFEGAYTDFIVSRSLDSLDIGILNNLSLVCFELEMDEDGFDYLYQIIRLDSMFVGSYINLGYRYQLKKQYEKSIEYFNKSERIDPDDALIYSNRSYSRLMLGDIGGAMKDIEKSIKLYPDNSYAYRNRALIYLEMGKTENACADLFLAKNKGFTQMYGEEVNKLLKKYCSQ